MKQLTIIQEDFNQMKQTARVLIECIFEREESFKEELINGNWGWTTKNYEIYNVHISSYRAKVVIRFDCYSGTDIVLELDDVYNWYLKENERV